MDNKTAASQSSEERITLLQRQWLERFVATTNVYRLYEPQHPQAQEAIVALHEVTLELQDIHDGEVSLSYSERTVAVIGSASLLTFAPYRWINLCRDGS